MKLAKTYFPEIKTILVTWYFDKFTTGEWEGLANAFVNRPDWVDYILADDNNGIYPAYVVKNGVPGNISLINFPEISMYGSMPWGGFGANPLPQYLQSLYYQSKDKISGGLSYSEGIFEDINKAIVSQLYWNGNKSVLEIMREYIGYEYSVELTEKILKVIYALEDSNRRNIIYFEHALVHECVEVPAYRVVIKNCKNINEVYKLVEEINGKLPQDIRDSWRWRILYLKGIIDYELASNMFEVNDICDNAFRELIRIYHAETADYVVSPPVIEVIKKAKGIL